MNYFNKVKKLGIITTFILSALSVQAFAIDVFGTDAYFIKVTESTNLKYVKFEFCNYHEQQCSSIGSNIFYSKEKLRKLKESEKWDVLKASAADVAIVIASIFTGGGAAYAIATTDAGMIYGTLIVGTTSGVAAPFIIRQFDSNNPYGQYKQLETLNDDVLNDNKVVVNYDVVTFANRLGTVLDNL